MEQFLQMAGVLAALYIAYALTLKKWDYASEAKRTERRTQLKELGLSNTFYFIHAGTLLILNAVSGGLFVLYWLFRQWKAALTGFRRLSGQPLSGGAFFRRSLYEEERKNVHGQVASARWRGDRDRAGEAP